MFGDNVRFNHRSIRPNNRNIVSANAIKVTGVVRGERDRASRIGTISSAVHKMRGGIHENLIAFLPGKAGSGSSTVVLHTARVLAQELKRRVLVIEGDLHSGPTTTDTSCAVERDSQRGFDAAPQERDVAMR